MKVVIPYVRLHPKTAAAVWDATEPGDEIVWADVSGDDSAYYKLLLERWRQGKTFVNLEQDKVPVPGALREIYDCEHRWCTYPHRWCTYPHLAHQGDWVADQPTLGCTKFSGEVMAKYPDLIERSGRLDIGTGPFHWKRLDMLVTAGLMWAIGECHVHEFGKLGHEHEFTGEEVRISAPTGATSQ